MPEKKSKLQNKHIISNDNPGIVKAHLISTETNTISGPAL